MMTYPKEENNYPKAVAISTAIMGGLLILSFFIVIGKFEPVEVGMGGMVVNYGTAAEGMGTDYTSIEEPSVDPNANNQPPDKVVPTEPTPQKPTPQSNIKEILTQNTEEAVSVNTKPSATTTAPSKSTETKPSKPVINQNALYKGKANKGSGSGDGTGTTPGNQGDKDGDPLANNYGEGGSGFGDNPLPLRSFVNFVPPKDDGQKTGKIVVKLFFNQNGTIIDARPGAKGTTLNDRELWQKCREAIMAARLNTSSLGPDVQSGVVTIHFKVK